MTVDSEGNVVTVEQRLDDIRERYLEDSIDYAESLELVTKLNLI